MQRTSFANDACPIARSLDVLGDGWVLLILREAFLREARRFDEFQRLGMADNVLSARLKTLVGAAIFDRVPYQEHPLRHEYHLSDKGRALGPVLEAMARWGRDWNPLTLPATSQG